MNREELHKIAPTLSKMDKGNFFKVPSYYFETVEDVVISSIKAEEFSVKLNKLTFKIPQDYFETLEDSIIAKLKSEALYKEQNETIPDDYFGKFEDSVLSRIKSEPKIIPLKTIAKYVAPLAIAASFLLIFLLNTTQEPVTFESLATSEIEQFIDGGMIDINEEELYYAFSDVIFDEDQLNTNLSEEEVLDYLMEEDLELLFYDD